MQIFVKTLTGKAASWVFVTMQIFVKTLTGKAASWVFVICRKDYYSRRRVLRYDREREG